MKLSTTKILTNSHVVKQRGDWTTSNTVHLKVRKYLYLNV